MSTTIAAREDARQDDGRFGVQQHTAPEAQLNDGPSPKALGMFGLGPASVNAFAEPLDSEEDRPLRPYLPLTPGDDDELWDARPGSRVVVSESVDGRTSLRTFVRGGTSEWEERSTERDVFVRTVETGEVWEAMFADDGTMRSSPLSCPPGTLYSDATGFVHRDRTDTPLSAEDALDRLAPHTRGILVSESAFGDTRDDGIPPARQGSLRVSVTGRTVQLQPVGGTRGTARTLNLDNVDIFERDGDIVFRQEKDEGYGWEQVLRLER